VRPATPVAYCLPVVPASRGVVEIQATYTNSSLYGGDQGSGMASQCQVASNQVPAGVPQRNSEPITYTAKMDAEHWLASERRLIERDEWTARKYVPKHSAPSRKHCASRQLNGYKHETSSRATNLGTKHSINNHIDLRSHPATPTAPSAGGIPARRVRWPGSPVKDDARR
jgi:hypothetical protein